MPATRPPRRGLSPKHFAWIFGLLLLAFTIFQIAQNRPQRFEPPPSSTSAEIGDDARPVDTLPTADSSRARQYAQ